ncbi:copper chaperone PCu(A)C [Streptacidiphilus sp. ASG 303]|uniref:copper chaperone PCu(A)C n=1 Tax=Streptacidiphilus sp. ASG 303 TaxID=2896847 RepID=UPI001E3F531F|nr:copper chaperone PCu(A)C [Streptacidiphilus sp. ASG 303]MCD0486419.1 copper chaperone PCu(A)C [Streptacidiphilus sp. ASG 303]
MSRSLRRGAIAALVALAVAPLSSCAASNDAESLQVKPDNASTSLGDDLQLNNIVLVTAPGGGAAESETRPAALSVNISNSGTAPEVLTSVSVGDAGTAALTGPGGGKVGQITVPAGGSVLLGGPGQPSVQIADASVQEGGYSRVTFTFDKAGTVTTQAAVVTGSGQYASFAPAAPAAPTAKASPTALPTGSGAPGAPTSSVTAGAPASASPKTSPKAQSSATTGARAGVSASPQG